MSLKNFMATSIFFLMLFSINIFACEPSEGIYESKGGEDKNKSIHTILENQIRVEEVEIVDKKDKLSVVSEHQENGAFETLQDDLLIYVLGFLNIENLGTVSQVSHSWCKVCSSPLLWKKVGFESYGYYFNIADLEENPKEKAIHHYLSVRLNILDAEEEDGVINKFKEKYGLTSFTLTPYFKAYLPSAVKKRYLSFNTKIYGKLKEVQDIEKEKEIEKLRYKRDDFINLAKSEATKKEIDNPYYNKLYNVAAYYGGSNNMPKYMRNPTVTESVPNRIRLDSAREINEQLIVLGDESAARMKKEQYTTSYSEYAGLNNLYRGHRGDWNNFVKNSVDGLCSRGYLFAFEWKIEWLLEQNENGTEFIESMLQNENPLVRNMGHYLKVFGLKQGKLGYKQNRKEAAQYIKIHNVPY